MEHNAVQKCSPGLARISQTFSNDAGAAALPRESLQRNTFGLGFPDILAANLRQKRETSR